MKIWIISDTHCQHNLLKIPEVDMVIHCGDFSNSPILHINELESRVFLDWYKMLPIKHKVLTLGNHDVVYYKGLINKEDYPEITILEHKQANIEGLRIFGSPYTPSYGNWAYMIKRNKISCVWESLPEDIDILITHGPPKYCLDLTLDRETNKPIQVGCKSLYNNVMRIKPKIHCFGHIHQEKTCKNYGMVYNEGVKFINAAIVSHHDYLIRPGHIVEI